jgi:glucose/arabinose dehydrogenase
VTARVVAAGLAAMVVLAAGAASAPAAQLEQVGTFSRPLSVAAPPGDPDRIYVTEQGGTIEEVVNGVKQSAPFLNITSLVDSQGNEEGLLSMAFAPDYATSHRFYVYYTGNAPTVDTTGDIEVDEFTASSPDHADPASRLRVITIAHRIQQNHNGGQLQFGPDGMLYLGTGDGGGGNDTQGNGQNLTVSDPSNNRSPLLAKILRINPLPTGGYTVPADNPFPPPAGPVWMLGLRNPYRFSFDRQTGAMIIGDVGQDLYEEIDYVPSPGPGQVGGRGANFGWNLREGLNDTGLTNETQGPNFSTDPVIQKTHNGDGFFAIIGGYVVRDPGLPELAGTYVYGDNIQGDLWDATLSGTTLSDARATGDRDLGLSVSSLSGMGEDACGRVYVTLLGGEVDRLVNDSGGYTCTAALATPTAPGAPAPSTPPPARAPSADKTPPKLTLLQYRSHQQSGALGRVLLHLGCNEQCTVLAHATLHAGRHTRRVAAVKLLAAGGSHVALKIKLSGVLRSLIRSALHHHRHPRVAVHLRISDAAGNVTRRAFNVVVTR